MCFQSQQWNKNDHLKSQVCFRRLKHFNGSTCDDSPRTTLHARSAWNTLQLVGTAKQTTKKELKVKRDHRSKFSNLSKWKEEAYKQIRASTGLESVTSAIPVRCFTNWAMKPHIASEANLLSSYLPVQWNDVKFIWNNSYLYCGCRWKWRVIIAVNFPI